MAAPSWRQAVIAACVYAAAAAAPGAGAVPVGAGVAARLRVRRAVPATLAEDAAVTLPRGGAVVTASVALLEAGGGLRVSDGPVPVHGCRNCRMDDEPAVQMDAVDPDTVADWSKHTTRRANNALKMMREIGKMPSSNLKSQEDDIAEDKHLLDLADKLKDRLVQTLGKQGISPRLPSEHPTYVDATGMHWEDAHMWDDSDNLYQKYYQDVKKDKAALKAELKRADIPQWHGSTTNNRLINEANPLRPLTVKKLSKAAPAPCNGANCVKVNTVPLLPERREMAEANTA